MIEKNARDIAVSAITAFRKNNAWSDGYLRNEIRNAKLSKRDAALATEIVNGVLQNKLLIEFYIKSFSSVKFNKISPGIIDILDVAIYQILFLTRIPDSAAVNDAVKRAKRNNPRAAGFVNAITRKISVSKNNLPIPQGDFSEILSIKYSHPKPLVDLLCSVYGEKTTEIILAENNKRPRISARVNTLKTSSDKLIDDLCSSDFKAEKAIIQDAVYLDFSGSIENETFFKDGLLHIQDIASQVAAKALDPKPGDSVLDACAAPGGKSFLLAQLIEDTGEIVSCDIYEHKLRLIKNGAERLGIKSIKTELADASIPRKEFFDRFDCVLADVPCSGLGIIRKKPDIRYKDICELKKLPELQLEILKNVSRYVKKGGALIYSTCTILPDENSGVISGFLNENSNFTVEEVPVEIDSVKNEYGYTLLPHISGTDGFYFCKLRRSK